MTPTTIYYNKGEQTAFGFIILIYINFDRL